MRSAEKRQRLQSFERLCRERGLSLTVQRRTVLEAVLDRGDHPTADQVYDEVKERLPGLSRTTVYRVLDALVRVGVINRICHPGAAARFDAKTDRHHHLVCLECEKIIDLEDERLNALEFPEVAYRGFEIREFQIHFRGLCAECRRKLSRNEAARRVPGRTGTRAVSETKPKVRSSGKRRRSK